MIHSLELRNYRGFSDYRVEHIADVNLFVGRNNVGKTSLLEAAQLIHSSAPLTTLRNIAVRRRETSARTYETSPGYYRELTDVSHIFHGHRLRLGRQVRIEGEGIAPVSFQVTQREDEVSVLEDFDWSELQQILLLLARRGDQIIERGQITDGGVLLDEQRIRRSQPSRARGDNTVFISPDSMSAIALVNLYNEVIVRAAEGGLVQALQLLDDKVTGVYFLASERSSGIDGSGGILIGRNGTERNPIGSFGDGMRRLLALAMAFVNTSGGVLLIDEVDTGLHYSVMRDLWKLILGSTMDLKIQAFTTTHSLDCVKGLHLALEEQPEVAVRVAVHKIDGRLNKAITFTGKELVNALRSDLELR